VTFNIKLNTMEERKLNDNDKLFLMFALLDIIEVYNMEVSKDLKFELKFAVNKAIKASRKLTNKLNDVIGPINEQFVDIAEEFQDIIENLYLQKT